MLHKRIHIQQQTKSFEFASDITFALHQILTLDRQPRQVVLNVIIDTHNHVHTRLVRYRLQQPSCPQPIQPVKDPTPWPTSKFAKAVHFTFLVLPFTKLTDNLSDYFSYGQVKHRIDSPNPSSPTTSLQEQKQEQQQTHEATTAVSTALGTLDLILLVISE
jgi:hypothetical protein